MARKIQDIKGIGPAFEAKLAESGIKTVEGLLEKGASKKGRKALSEATGIDAKQILVWVNKADLFRVKGIGEQFSHLLKLAGVDTVKELRTRKPENLHAKLTAVNEEKGAIKMVPALVKVQGFVALAKELEPVVTH